MSWVQLHDEVWPVTKDEANLYVFIHAADVGCPRVHWHLEASHYIQPKEPVPPEEPKMERWLAVELDGLILNLTDWRRLGGLQIRADSAWHATQEFMGPYGHVHNSPRVMVYQTVLRPYAARAGVEAGRSQWVAHDFLVRFGKRDGWSFPCELEAWLIPEKDYYRLTAETPAETARFGEGPASFHLITRASFTEGTVDLTRAAAADPVAHAKEALAAEIACDTMLKPNVSWMLRPTRDGNKSEPMPGWRSTVHFYTPASSYAQSSA